MALRRISGRTASTKSKDVVLMQIGRCRIGVNRYTIEAMGTPERIDIFEEDETLELVVAPEKELGHKVVPHASACFSSEAIENVVSKHFKDKIEASTWGPYSGYKLQIPGRIEDGMAKFRIADAVKYSRNYYTEGSPFMEKWHEING